MNIVLGTNKKFHVFLEKPLVMVQYKTFDLKHNIVLVKIGPPTSQIKSSTLGEHNRDKIGVWIWFEKL